MTLTTDLTRNITVPNLGPQVTVTGTVKDARGKVIPYANLSVLSNDLVTAAVVGKSFVGGLDVSEVGTYTLHALPGSYAMSIALATGSTGASTPDAGATSPKDAAPDLSFNMPDLSFSLPDIAFSLPDLGSSGDCTTLQHAAPH